MLRVKKIDYEILQTNHSDTVFLTRCSRAGVVTLWPKLLDTQPPHADVCEIGPSRPDDVRGSMLDEVRRAPERQVAKPWPVAITAKNFLLNMGIATAALIIVPGFATAAALKWGAMFGAAVALPFARTQAEHLRKDDSMLGFCEAAEELRQRIVIYHYGRRRDDEDTVFVLSERVMAMADTPMKQQYYQFIRRFAAARSVSLSSGKLTQHAQGVITSAPHHLRAVMLPPH